MRALKFAPVPPTGGWKTVPVVPLEGLACEPGKLRGALAELLWPGRAARLQVEGNLPPLVVPQQHHLAVVVVGVGRAARHRLGWLFGHSCLLLRLASLPVDRHGGVLNQ